MVPGEPPGSLPGTQETQLRQHPPKTPLLTGAQLPLQEGTGGTDRRAAPRSDQALLPPLPRTLRKVLKAFLLLKFPAPPRTAADTQDSE